MERSLSPTGRVPGSTFTDERRVTTNATGVLQTRVPYPGTYTLANRTITVPDAAVENGTTVSP